jgi:hypothetical protein
MHQDKDRSSKWLLSKHGDAILEMAGIRGFTSWKHLPSELVAPRRILDGLFELRFPNRTEPMFVLVEIESYDEADADRQVFEDIALVLLEYRVIPEVVLLVLKPKGNQPTRGSHERRSSRGTTGLSGFWPVIRLWEIEAEVLLNAPNIGAVPWATLAHSTLQPEELLKRCAERYDTLGDPAERSSYQSVTLILAGLAYPNRSFFHLFGGSSNMIQSPVLDEIVQTVEKQVSERIEKETQLRILVRLQDSILTQLARRFGSVNLVQQATLKAVNDLDRLLELHSSAATCTTVDEFNAALLAIPAQEL